ncbi:MAG: glyoxalase [Gammaproteobacteria bacterium]|nr:MAG: glyoxalase [Gammaproteobacteria bacterium]
MQLRYTILYVNDVAASVDFYQRAFGIPAEFTHASGDYAQLDTGETRLAFSSRTLMTSLGKHPAKADARNPVFEIALETDDVPGALAKALAAGAVLIQDARDESWGQTTAYISDPDGYLVEICSPVSG